MDGNNCPFSALWGVRRRPLTVIKVLLPPSRPPSSTHPRTSFPGPGCLQSPSTDLRFRSRSGRFQIRQISRAFDGLRRCPPSRRRHRIHHHRRRQPHRRRRRAPFHWIPDSEREQPCSHRVASGNHHPGSRPNPRSLRPRRLVLSLVATRHPAPWPPPAAAPSMNPLRKSHSLCLYFQPPCRSSASYLRRCSKLVGPTSEPDSPCKKITMASPRQPGCPYLGRPRHPSSAAQLPRELDRHERLRT